MHVYTQTESNVQRNIIAGYFFKISKLRKVVLAENVVIKYYVLASDHLRNRLGRWSVYPMNRNRQLLVLKIKTVS